MLRRLFRTIAPITVALFLTSSLWAIGQSETAGEGGGSEPAEASNELTVYTYDVFPEGLAEAIRSHFEDEYGVSVTIERFADTGQLFNQVYLDRNNPQADAVIGLDNSYLGRIYESELFEAYEPENMKLRHDFLQVDDRFRVVPFDFGYVTLNYDTDALQDPPRSWEELAAPEYRDSIVLMNPATASPGRNFMLLTVAEFGEDRFTEYWERLKPNVLTVTSTWSEGYGLYTQGEAPIVVSYSTSPAYHQEYEDSDRYKALYINDTAYAQIEIAGITNGAENRRNAERFIDFILSPSFQSRIALNQIMYPVHPDVSLPDSFEELPEPGNTVALDATRVQQNVETWLDEWEQVMR